MFHTFLPLEPLPLAPRAQNWHWFNLWYRGIKCAKYEFCSFCSFYARGVQSKRLTEKEKEEKEEEKEKKEKEEKTKRQKENIYAGSTRHR